MILIESRIVASEELRDTWLRGWGMWLLAVIAVAFGAVAIAIGYSSQLNLLEAKEGLAILVRMSIAVGVLLVVLSMADSISGMRDRSTLEAMLLTPIRRTSLVGGKLAAASVGWVAALVISLPYLYVVGEGLGKTSVAIVVSLVLGALMSVMLGAGAATLSIRSRTNLQTLGVGLVGLALLAIPVLLPSAVLANPVGEFIARVDPLSAAQHLIGAVVVNERTLGSEASWLASPVAWAIVAVWLAWRSSGSIELEPRN